MLDLGRKCKTSFAGQASQLLKILPGFRGKHDGSFGRRSNRCNRGWSKLIDCSLELTKFTCNTDVGGGTGSSQGLLDGSNLLSHVSASGERKGGFGAPSGSFELTGKIGQTALGLRRKGYTLLTGQAGKTFNVFSGSAGNNIDAQVAGLRCKDRGFKWIDRGFVQNTAAITQIMGGSNWPIQCWFDW